MFGVMKPQDGCSAHQDHHHHRQHYCGTCKAIGQAYGQHSRLLLNFDGVFLAELLTHLNDQAITKWEPRLQTPNTCLKMPKEEAPFALRYAGAATLLFSALSVNDQITDRNQWQWQWTKRLYQTAFDKALKDLQQWGVDVAFIQQQASQQQALEQTSIVSQHLEDLLHHYSLPTQQITAHIFEHSVTNEAQRPIMAALGRSFGQLLYALDAFEDYEKDVFNQEFNPLAQYWDAPRQLQEAQLDQVRQLMLQYCTQFNTFLAQLPLEADFLLLQQSRLDSNLALRLYQDRSIPQTWKERLQQRYQNAQETAKSWLCVKDSPLYRLQYYMVVLAVFVSPQTKNYLPQDGKLETLGWMTFATAVLAGWGWVRTKRYNPPIKKKKKKKRRRWGKRRHPDQQNNCGQCATNCGSVCCQSCVDGTCNCCCDAIKESENPGLTILLILGCIILITGIIVLLVILA